MTMRPLKSPAEVDSAMSKVLNAIDEAFEVSSVHVHNGCWIRRPLAPIWVGAGAYPVRDRDECSKGTFYLVAASPLTARHLLAIGQADLHMRNGEVKFGVAINQRGEEFLAHIHADGSEESAPKDTFLHRAKERRQEPRGDRRSLVSKLGRDMLLEQNFEDTVKQIDATEFTHES